MKISFKDINTKSNYISIFRIFLALPIIYFINNSEAANSYRYYALCLMIFATITDLLDGYLARKLNEITEFGKIIDPLADKLVIAAITVDLFLLGDLPAYYFWIIILRDILIFAGGIYVSKLIGKVLPSNLLGKLTVISIGCFLIITVIQVEKSILIYAMFLYASLILSILSVMGYALRAYEFIKWKKNESL